MLFYLSIILLLVVQWGFHFLRIWWIITIRTMVLGISSTTTTRPHLWVWDNIAFTFENDSNLVGRDWWFLIKSSFFLKPSWRWWRRKIGIFTRSCKNAWFASLIITPRFIDNFVLNNFWLYKRIRNCMHSFWLWNYC